MTGYCKIDGNLIYIKRLRPEISNNILYKYIYIYISLFSYIYKVQPWAPAGIFPGGGGKPLGGPKKSVKGVPHIIFRQALKYVYRRGGGSFDAHRVFFSRGPKSIKVDLQNL